MAKKYFFEALAEQIQEKWEFSLCNLEQFPEIATTALENLKYAMSLEELNQEIASWFLNSDSLPEQIQVHNTFGQPPITLFNNGKFLVEVYIWVNFDTAIHSHGFRGAFRLLHGQSLQEQFFPLTQESCCDDIKITKLGPAEIQLLFPGDITPIFPDEKLVHRLIHLQNPTVTLCVKTINEENLPQWSYFPNGLAIQKRQISAEMIKQTYFTQYLLGINYEQAMSFFSTFIKNLKPSVQLNLAEELLSGSMDLHPEFAHLFFDHILESNRDSSWHERFTELPLLNVSEFNFDHFDNSEERLLCHFMNCNYPQKVAIGYLARLRDTPPEKMNLAPLLLRIFAEERTFGTEVSSQLLRNFQECILNPERATPNGLRQHPQYLKLKNFLKENP